MLGQRTGRVNRPSSAPVRQCVGHFRAIRANAALHAAEDRSGASSALQLDGPAPVEPSLLGSPRPRRAELARLETHAGPSGASSALRLRAHP